MSSGVYRKQYQALDSVNQLLVSYKDRPYQLPYKEYCILQDTFQALVSEINQKYQIELTSRIELNLLWAE